MSGPTGGLRGAPTVEPSWAGQGAVERQKRQSLGGVSSEAGPQRRGPGSAAMPERFTATDADDDELAPRRASKVPAVLLLAAVLIGGGGFVLWRFVLAPPGTPPGPVAALPTALVDAGPPLAHPLDAGAAPAAESALDGLAAALDDGSDPVLAAQAELLAAARTSVQAQDAEVLAALARVEAAWADAFSGEAVLSSDPRAAEQARAEARRHAQRAETFAAEASVKAPDAIPVILARADARRVNGAKPAEIDKLVAPVGRDPEAAYARAMARLSAGKSADARKLLEGMLGGGKAEPRARWQLALLAYVEHRRGDAQTHLDALLTLDPENPRARALASKLAEAPAGPPDAGPPPAAPDAGVVARPVPTPIERVPVDYDALLRKANARAESGDCSGALPIYDKALDVRPGGVEALTGMGYCLMDKKEFARAQTSFRAALGVSPRYGDAIMGLGEACRAQHDDDKAAVQYRRYLELYPAGPRAKLAQRRLEALAPAQPSPQTPPDQLAPEPSPPPAPAPESPSQPSGEPPL
jgi:tetratricopeptide (TPR) repeat protein